MSCPVCGGSGREGSSRGHAGGCSAAGGNKGSSGNGGNGGGKFGGSRGRQNNDPPKGKKRRFGGLRITPVDSILAAQSKSGEDKSMCPPHDFYKLSEEVIDGQKYRTDICRRKGCKVTHGYFVK